MTEPLTPAQRASIGWRGPRGHVRRGLPVPLLPAVGRRPDPVGRLRRDLPPGQPRRPAARPAARDVRHAGAQLPGDVPAARRRSRFTHRWGGAIDTTTRFHVTFGDALGGRRPLRAGLHGPRRRLEPLGGGDPARPAAATRLAAARARVRPVAAVPDPARAHPDPGRGADAARGDLGRRARGRARACSSGRWTRWGSASTARPSFRTDPPWKPAAPRGAPQTRVRWLRSAPNAAPSSRRVRSSAPSAVPGSPSAPASREVRKVVTVLFADVTGSTALGERLDPETLRALMTATSPGCARSSSATAGRSRSSSAMP